MWGNVDETAKGNEGNNNVVGTRQVTGGSDGNGEGAARPVAESFFKNEADDSWLLIRDFSDKCRINKEIGHDDDDSDWTMSDTEEEPSSSSSNVAENERPPPGPATNEKEERVILHWDDTLEKYVQGFRPGHKMVCWDAEKKAYVFCYYKEPPLNPAWPPIFHYDKELQAFVEGSDPWQTMCWWDPDHKWFTRRLTPKMVEAFQLRQGVEPQ